VNYIAGKVNYSVFQEKWCELAGRIWTNTITANV